ncbi:MAG: amidohydrolase [Chloroflexi bacterium]|nr:amidohydrolase [Chloroflexota bacterium]
MRGERIAALSLGSDPRHVAEAGTRTIDCRGRTIVPGFIDPHVHIMAYAGTLQAVDCSPSAVRSIADIKEAIRCKAASVPPGRWVRAAGYDEFHLEERRHPTRWDLDDAAPNHPVRLVHRSHHACVLNSLAMAIAAIGNETEEPPGGTIERELTTGEPNGLLLDMNAYLGDRGVPPPLQEEELIEAMRLANEYLLSRGVTSLEDASAGNDVAAWATFSRLKDGRLLEPRLRMMLGIGALAGAQEAGLSFGYGDERLRVGAVKLTQMESEPKLYPGQAELNEQALKAHVAGFQVAIHATEERSVAAATDAIAYALQARPRSDHRHRVEHCSVCPPYLQAKLRDLGAVVVTQPGFLYYSADRYIDRVPAESLPWLYPMRSLLDAGVPLAAGSDCPIIPPDPLLGIFAALARQGRTGLIVSVEQKLMPGDALRAHTISAAYASFSEAALGSLSPGKLADAVILSADPLAAPPEEIKAITVEATVLGGRVVWRGN